MPFPRFVAEQLCDPNVWEKIACPVCADIFENPKCGPCGHILCDKCWTLCLHSGTEICPVCRHVVDAGHRIAPWNQAMDFFLGAIRIRCASPGCH
jgi:hypothetical protein